MARIRWTEKALADLDAIREFVGQSSPRYGLALVARLARAPEQLRQHPESGRIVPELERSDVRELVRGSYRVVYRLVDDHAVILTVFRASRLFPDLGPEFSRPPRP